MEPATEFVIRVKRWPAYTLAVLVPVIVVLYVSLTALMVLWGLSSPVTLALFVTTVAAQLLVLGLMVRSTVQAFTMIRYPPRVSRDGLRLWLFPTSTYPLVAWEQIAGVRTTVMGIARGLFVHVHDPESLAGPDTAKLRRLKRAMRRFNGAPFVYAIQASPARLNEIDHAVWRYSEGRFRLHNQ